MPGWQDENVGPASKRPREDSSTPARSVSTDRPVSPVDCNRAAQAITQCCFKDTDRDFTIGEVMQLRYARNQNCLGVPSVCRSHGPSPPTPRSDYDLKSNLVKRIFVFDALRERNRDNPAQPYSLFGESVCSECWIKAHGVPRSTFFHHKKRYLEGFRADDEGTRPGRPPLQVGPRTCLCVLPACISSDQSLSNRMRARS